MKKITHFVGLDVHKDSIAIAVAEAGRETERMLATIAHDLPSLLKKLKGLASMKQIHCCYEAGPTGFALQRKLTKLGILCEIIAPSLTPRRSGDRIKTDRRDALALAHYLRSGDLTKIHIPDEDTEAIRDLERARDDAKNAERRARQQLSHFLLRHGRRYEKKTSWSAVHLDWMRKQVFDREPQRRVLLDYIRTVEQATERVNQLDKEIHESILTWTGKPMVDAFQSLRGVRETTAVAIAAEVTDFRRFPKASQFMAYTGLVPSENSSGESRRQGCITKTGNRRLRRLLTEAAWNYRFAPRRSAAIRKRNEGLPQEIQDVAWKAQKRLHDKYTNMIFRKKPAQETATAVARELAGFIWSIGSLAQRTTN